MQTGGVLIKRDWWVGGGGGGGGGDLKIPVKGGGVLINV